MVACFIFLIMNLGRAQIYLLEDEKLITENVSNRLIPSLEILTQGSLKLDKICRVKIYFNQGMIEILLLGSLDQTHIVYKSTNQPSYFNNGIFKQLENFEVFLKKEREDVRCHDFDYILTRTQLFCSTGAIFKVFICKMECYLQFSINFITEIQTLLFLHRFSQYKTKFLINHNQSLTINEQQVDQIQELSELEQRKIINFLNGFSPISNVINSLDHDYPETQRAYQILAQKYFSWHMDDPQQRLEFTDLYTKFNMPSIKISSTGHYILNGELLNITYDESQVLILFPKAEKGFIIYNSSFVWHENFKSVEGADLVIPYVQGTFLSFKDNIISILRLNQFREYVAYMFSQSQILVWKPQILLDQLRLQKRAYFHHYENRKNTIKNLNDVFFLAENITIEPNNIEAEVVLEKNYLNLCINQLIVFSDHINNEWLIQFVDEDAYQLILVSCEPKINISRKISMNLRLDSSLLVHISDKIFFVKEPHKIMELYSSEEISFSLRILKLAQFSCTRLLVEFEDNSTLVLDEHFTIISEHRTCIVFDKVFTFAEYSIYIGSKNFRNFSLYTFEHPIIRYDFLSFDQLLIWFQGTHIFVNQYYYKGSMLYKIKELPLFNYTVDFTQPTQVLYYNKNIAITVYNGEGQKRVLSINLSKRYGEALKNVFQLEKNDTFIIKQFQIVIKQNNSHYFEPWYYDIQTKEIITEQYKLDKHFQTYLAIIYINGIGTIQINCILLNHFSRVKLKDSDQKPVEIQYSYPLIIDISRFVWGHVFTVQSRNALLKSLIVKAQILLELPYQRGFKAKVVNRENLLIYQDKQLVIRGLAANKTEILKNIDTNTAILVSTLVETICTKLKCYGVLVYQQITMPDWYIHETKFIIIDIEKRAELMQYDASGIVKSLLQQQVATYQNLIFITDKEYMYCFRIDQNQDFLELSPVFPKQGLRELKIYIVNEYLVVQAKDQSFIATEFYSLNHIIEHNEVSRTQTLILNISEALQTYSLPWEDFFQFQVISIKQSKNDLVYNLIACHSQLALIIEISKNCSIVSNTVLLDNTSQFLYKILVLNQTLFIIQAVQFELIIQYFSLNTQDFQIFALQRFTMTECTGKILSFENNHMLLLCALRQQQNLTHPIFYQLNYIEINQNYIVDAPCSQKSIEIDIRGEQNAIQLNIQLRHNVYIERLLIIGFFLLLLIAWMVQANQEMTKARGKVQKKKKQNQLQTNNC